MNELYLVTVKRTYSNKPFDIFSFWKFEGKFYKQFTFNPRHDITQGNGIKLLKNDEITSEKLKVY